MREIIHIMRKDARHLWPFAAGLAGLCVVFVAASVRIENGWSIDPAQIRLRNLQQAMVLALPAAWVLVIALAVQADALDGDNHFWLTRPHSRWKLLAAKSATALLVVLGTLVPSQAAIVAGRGFPLLDSLSGLVGNAVWTSATIVLSALALAAVSRNLATMVLTVVALYLASMLSTMLLTGPSHGALSWVPFALTATVVVGAAAVVVLTQFLARRTGRSRIVLGAACAAVAVLSSFDVWSAAFAVQQLKSIEPAPNLKLEIAPGAARFVPPRFTAPWRDARAALMMLPVLYRGTDGTVRSERVRFRLELPSGGWWDSPGLPGDRIDHAPHLGHYWMALRVPRDVAGRAAGQPVKIVVDAHLTLYRDRSRTTTPATMERTYIPGVGFCSSGVMAEGDNLGVACEHMFEPDRSVFVDLENRGRRVGRTLTTDAPYGPVRHPPAINPGTFRAHHFQLGWMDPAGEVSAVVGRPEDLATARLEWTFAEKTVFFRSKFELEDVRLSDWEVRPRRD
jgi:hypothetical protein